MLKINSLSRTVTLLRAVLNCIKGEFRTQFWQTDQAIRQTPPSQGHSPSKPANYSVSDPFPLMKLASF